MTPPKTNLSPGETMQVLFDRLGMFLVPHRTTENFRLLAQAAIDAARDLEREWCENQTRNDEWSVSVRPKEPPPTSTQTEDEREHCERVAEVLWTKARSLLEMSECVLAERAAVRAECQAEIDRLKAELNRTPLVRRVGATGIINDTRKAWPDVLEFSRDGGKTWTR